MTVVNFTHVTDTCVRCVRRKSCLVRLAGQATANSRNCACPKKGKVYAVAMGASVGKAAQYCCLARRNQQTDDL